MAVEPPVHPSARREPGRCPFRRPLDAASDRSENSIAICGFLEQLSGIRDPDLVRVGLDACEACCLEAEPAGERLNSVIASFLFGLTVDEQPRLGSPLWNPQRIDHLRNLALAYMERVEAPSPPQPSRVPAYSGPCLFLGPESGRVECTSCRGRVMLKEFECSHPFHDRTTIQSCRSCQDYEAPLERGTVRSWAVAVTTASRESPTLARTLDSLRRAGWKNVLVFAEPGSKIPRLFNRSFLSTRREILGAWGNWFLTASELAVRYPNADAYLICQDDAVFCRNLRDYLESQLWPATRLGVVSLHTPRHHTGESPGFFPLDVGWGAWGAMAYAFPNASLRALLSDARVVNHRNRGPGDGLRNVDSVVGAWCRRRGLPYFLHTPSLCEHTGTTSTLWQNASLEGRRSSADFPGEDCDAGSVAPAPASDSSDSERARSRHSQSQLMASLSQDPASSETAGFGFVIDLAAPSQDVLLSSLLALSHLPTEVLFLTPGDRELPVSAHPAWTRVPLPDPARGPFPDAAIGDFLLSAASPWIVFPESPAPLPPDSLGRLARLLQDARPTDGYLRTDPESTGGVLPSLTILRRGAALELCLFDEPALLRNASKARLRLRELGWRDAAYPSEAAGEPFLPLRFAWQDYRLTVITVLIGRRTCFPDWLNWIRTEKFPTETRLHLVDNSADRDFGALLRNAAATLLAEGRFSGLTLLRGPGPYLEGPRLNIRRCLNFAHALNLTLPSVMGDLALTVDCDTIPEAGAVAHLLDAYTNRRHAGCRPGVVSGLCESATCRGHLTAARSRTAWRDMPRVDEIPHGELVEAGFAGNGCCLMPVPAMREALPMRAELLPGGGIAGPDHVLCRALRERGYSVWLHGSVRCRHLF